MRFAYYGPHCRQSCGEFFGCLTYGFPDTDVFTDQIRFFPELEGENVYGNYEDCLELARSVGERAKAERMIFSASFRRSCTVLLPEAARR